MIAIMSRYSPTSSSSQIRPWPGMISVPPSSSCLYTVLSRMAFKCVDKSLNAASIFDVDDRILSRGEPFFIGSFHVQKRVWIAEEKLNDFPFDLLSLTFQIRRGERMVSGDRTRGKRKQWQERTLHKQNVSYWFSPRADCTKRQMWGPNQKSLSVWEWGHTAVSDGRFLSR